LALFFGSPATPAFALSQRGLAAPPERANGKPMEHFPDSGRARLCTYASPLQPSVDGIAAVPVPG